MSINRLKELRKNKKLTQKELGEALNVDQTTISKLETEQQAFTAQLLTMAANFFNVSTDYLLGNDVSVPPSSQPKDLKHLLESESVALNGRMFSSEDKEKILKIIEAAFWEAKEANKRKK